jgi:anti-sigma B factor antagonist
MRPEASSSYRPFSISVDRSSGEVALVVVGELDLASADKLGQAVAEVHAAGFTDIALDLRGADFIDSTGLRMLLGLRNDAKRDEHALTLVPPAPTVRRIFALTGTRGLFDWRGNRPGR